LISTIFANNNVGTSFSGHYIYFSVADNCNVDYTLILESQNFIYKKRRKTMKKILSALALVALMVAMVRRNHKK
jgi:hypothetical protein